MIYKYNNYTTKKIPYRRIINGIKIIKISKQPLSITYRGKKKNYWLGLKGLALPKKLKKVKAYRTKGS